ncbi:MAG: HlyD family type I secretion periplasmic adaptor subunit [Desulfovibrionaceae bacterium]|nr:HlyD family type I secretion periplasmic adaptor subunit [Desulfovibrionaceae bacterium]MBF0512784.1 HlyD family type I secretion periplasmic adaptor subunit [Desulfovibrionaceae bacterium]
MSEKKDNSLPSCSSGALAGTGSAPPAMPAPGGVPAEFLEFQPDSLELEMAPLPGRARISLYMAVACILIGLVWACLAQIDRIVTGQGKVAAPQSNLVLSALEPAVIRKIHVLAGQRVQAGDLLVTLDSTFTRADLADAVKHFDSLTAQIWRIRCELGQGACTPPASLDPAEAAMQMSLLLGRKAEYQGKMASYDKAISGLDTQIASLAAQREQGKRRIANSREVEAMHQIVFEKGAGSRLEMLKAQNERIQNESDYERMGHEMKTKTEDLAKNRADRDAFAANWNGTLSKELVDTQRDAGKIGEQLEKAKRMNELIELRAPGPGVVLDVARKSVGSVAEKAEALVTLVPLDAPLEAQVDIPAKEIGFVREGDPARIKLEAFPFQKHGVLEGRVATVSEDAFAAKDNQQGATPQAAAQGASQVNYRARIEIVNASLRDVPKDFRLIPGMTLTAEIKVGKRRIISYLIYPVVRALDEAMREP